MHDSHKLAAKSRLGSLTFACMSSNTAITRYQHAGCPAMAVAHLDGGKMINRTLASLSLGSWPPSSSSFFVVMPRNLFGSCKPLPPLHANNNNINSHLLRHQWAGLSPNDQRRRLLGFAACACLPNPPCPVPASCYITSC